MKPSVSHCCHRVLSGRKGGARHSVRAGASGIRTNIRSELELRLHELKTELILCAKGGI